MSVSSVGLSRYAAREMGFTPGSSMISCSWACAGGTPAGRSFGIISLYYSNTSFTDAGSSELGFSSSSAAITSAKKPVLLSFTVRSNRVRTTFFHLLEQHLLAAETSVVAVGAARGTPRTPFFEGCSPSPLAPSYASAAAADILGAEDVGAASASGKRRSSKGEGSKSGGGGSGGGSGSGGGGGGGSEGGGAVEVVEGVGALVAAVEAAVGVAVVAAVGMVAAAVEMFRGEVLAVASGSSSSVGARPLHPSSFVSGLLSMGPLEVVFTARMSGFAIFDLDYDAILAAMNALSVSAEGDCYLCVPPDPGTEAAALGASESALPGTVCAEALHTIKLDSGASRYFFRDSTTLTPLIAPVPVRFADPSGGPALARSSTVLPCLVVPSASLSGLHLPLFSTNLVSTAALQDAMVTTTTPGGQRVSICTCTQMGRHLATFTRRPGSSILSCGTTALVTPHCHAFVACTPASLSLVFPCPCLPYRPRLPYVEGRQHSAPHSSSFPPTTAPLQTLHMDVWGPACVSGQGRERYFLQVVGDYTRYTTVFPLRSKGEVPDVLIPWIRAVRLQLRERFRQDLPVLRRHSDEGGEFSSNLLRDFCCGEGILQSFTLPASPQQNGIAEHRIGLVMELNLWPRVSLPETSPTLRWMGKVGDLLVFRVWGSRAFVRDSSADKLFAHAIPCVLLGFVPDSLGWQFYHLTSRRVLPSQDVMFDESVPFYCLFPYRSAPPPPPPLFLAPGPPPVEPLPPQGPAPFGVSQVDPLPGTVPFEVAVASGAAVGAASGVAEPGGDESKGAGFEGAERGGSEPGGAESGGVEHAGGEPGGAEPKGVQRVGAESVGAELRGTASSGGAGDAGAGGAGVTSGVGGTNGAAAAGRGGARTTGTGAAGTGSAGGAGAGDPPGPGGVRAGGAGGGGAGASGAGAGGARAGDSGAVGAGTGGIGAGGTGAGGAGAMDTGAIDPGAGSAGAGGAVSGGIGAGRTVRPRPFLVPLLCQPDSPLPAPSPYAEQTDSFTERREPESRPVLPVRAVCTGRRVPRPRPPPVPGTNAMALRPSSIPLRVPLRAPPNSCLPDVPDTEFDLSHAASPNGSPLLATVITDPSFESTTASALVAELLDFAVACRLDYATALIADFESASPPSVKGGCALGTDVLEDR
ncbi:unnamed protein product [Closterium sp. NIES-54]